LSTQTPAAPNVTVQVNNPPVEPSPFGIEARISEVFRRLEDCEREISSLKAEQAALKTRDSTFEQRLAELVVAKESLERLAAELKRSQENSAADITNTLKEFRTATDLQREEDRETRKDLAKLAAWRTGLFLAVAAIGAALGSSGMKLLEKVIPGLSRHEVKATAEAVASLFL
jgi:chromosome condensin MukBEF ATPase and DNA-binding subunit MukB